ncbi:hypothetical protein EDD15DRAFT_1461228 [Pisolithus albus]|nr:hypothetical protein EDD15DRAFT_1461228 [Pisolithus albus]
MIGWFHLSLHILHQKRDSNSKHRYRHVSEPLVRLKWVGIYLQRSPSLVLLTHHQYSAFFTKVISKLGSLFRNHGITMLETAYHNVGSRFVHGTAVHKTPPISSVKASSTFEFGLCAVDCRRASAAKSSPTRSYLTLSRVRSYSAWLLASLVPLYPPHINLLGPRCPILVYDPSHLLVRARLSDGHVILLTHCMYTKLEARTVNSPMNQGGAQSGPDKYVTSVLSIPCG